MPRTIASQGASAKVGGGGEADGSGALLSFQAERRSPTAPAAPTTPVSATPTTTTVTRRRVRIYFIAAVGAAIAAAIGGIVYSRSSSVSSAASTRTIPLAQGTAMIDSHPPGAVTIDGVARGSTPLVISLPAGQHAMEVVVGTTIRSLPLMVEAGTTTKQDLEFPTAAAVTTGQLDISSDPSGAQVNVDGIARGATPLRIETMAPGEHEVVMSKGPTTIRQTVTIKAGAAASIAASMVEAVSAGWVSLKAPFNLDVLEDGQMIGTTAVTRLMLPSGEHRFELRNGTFEVNTTLSVQVVAGKTVNVTVPVPNGLLSINATPWANVSIDGQDVGLTPLANLSVPVGQHQVVWRNPQLGERRRSVDVTARSPVRVGMDFAQ
jgi:hypothetical protein